MISVCVMIQKGHIQCEKISLALKKQPYLKRTTTSHTWEPGLMSFRREDLFSSPYLNLLQINSPPRFFKQLSS